MQQQMSLENKHNNNHHHEISQEATGYKIKDGQTDLYVKDTIAVSSIAIGGGMIIHNFWHSDPIMLGIGFVLMVLGLYMAYQGNKQRNQRMDDLTKGYFLRHQI